LRGIKIDWSDDDENANDSIRVNRELDSNEIDENDLHREKQEQPRMLISHRIWTVDDLEKLQINLWWTISIKRSFSITNISFPLSIVIDDKFTQRKAEPLMNRTLRGIKIDWSDDLSNADDSIRVNREFDSNEIDKSDSQWKKHDEQRFSRLRGTKNWLKWWWCFCFNLC
jgi:hypothetical protein